MARKDERPFNDLRQRRSEVQRISELAGQAKIDTHEAAGDPHDQYLTQAEADALYAPDAVTELWMPLVSIEGGTPQVVLDADDSLIPTKVPL